MSPHQSPSSIASTFNLAHTGSMPSTGTSNMTTLASAEETPRTTHSITNKVLVDKWGKTLIDAGFTVLPNVLFRNQTALKLKPLDVLIILHLASYWWRSDDNPRPAKTTVAASLNVTPRTVQRSIKKMEDMGYIKRIMRKADIGDNMPNLYDLRGLVLAGKPIAEEQIALKAKRAKEDKTKLATPATFALNQGEKNRD